MSFLMILRIAVKALSRNKMRTALTMLGMIIGVAAVITMVALGTGAQTLDRGADSVGRHEHDHRVGRQLLAGRRAPGPGQRQHAGARRCRGDRAACRACSTSPPASNTRGQIVAGNQNWNTQVQGTDVDLPLIRSWPTTEGAFFTPQDVATASKVAVLGSVVRDQLFGAGRRPDRPGHPHHEPAVHRRRRDGEQGPVGHGPGSGRRDLRAVHDGDEEAARHHLHPAGHGVGGVGRRDDAGRRQHRRAAARAPQDPAGRSRTTSWCARWRKWRASARKRRRR